MGRRSGRGRSAKRATLAVVAVVLAWGALSPDGASGRTKGMASAASVEKACSRGVVALTFDDGPQTGDTAQLLSYLHRAHVPATFFLVGDRIPGHSAVVRQMTAYGLKIGNHTLHHERLTGETNAGISASLAETRRRIVAAGGKPSNLVRPPYGTIDSRVVRVVRGAGYIPVLWNVDSRDWAGGSPAQIAAHTLGQLRPGRNLVLQHDGVANSHNSVTAVPIIVDAARARGYCLGVLDGGGRPALPSPPTIRVYGSRVEERNPGHLLYATFTLRLSRPSPEPVRVYVHTHNRTARAGVAFDYKTVTGTVTVAPGRTRATVRARIYNDRKLEYKEYFRLHLSRPRRTTIAKPTAVVVITDDDR